MKKTKSIIWFLFFISLLWIYFNFDFLTSVIPGCDTSIYSIWEIVLAIVVLAFVSIVILVVLKNVLVLFFKSKY